MSFTADLDKFSALISFLDLKDSSSQDNQNGIAYHSLNEQMMAKLQGSIFNSRNDSRKLVGNPLGLTSALSSTGSNSSLASPPYAPTSSVLSCLGLQSSDTMLQMCPEESGRLMDEDQQQQQQQELMNGHRRLDRSASEPYNRGLASSAYSVTRTASNNSSSSSSNSSGGSGSSYCRYKTELCRPFDENGSCKYGDKCQFAHGRHELRSLARHPKYKTDLCKTYHTTGLCPYGPRCHFIHNDEERQLNLVNRLVLEHKKTQAMYEQHRTQLAHQQQVIAAAVAAQKLLQQQQQHPTLTKQMSVDAALMAAQQLQQQSQLQHQTSALFNYRGSVDSSSDSQSSSITESPSPSPTSLMFEDPAATMTKHNSAAYRMTGTNAWSSLDETTHVSGSSDALQTILESILKNKSTGSRLSFRDCIGEAENSYSSFQSVGYLH